MSSTARAPISSNCWAASAKSAVVFNGAACKPAPPESEPAIESSREPCAQGAGPAETSAVVGLFIRPPSMHDKQCSEGRSAVFKVPNSACSSYAGMNRIKFAGMDLSTLTRTPRSDCIVALFPMLTSSRP